jgi:hypothetical protein
MKITTLFSSLLVSALATEAMDTKFIRDRSRARTKFDSESLPILPKRDVKNSPFNNANTTSEEPLQDELGLNVFTDREIGDRVCRQRRCHTRRGL